MYSFSEAASHDEAPEQVARALAAGLAAGLDGAVDVLLPKHTIEREISYLNDLTGDGVLEPQGVKLRRRR